MHKLNRESCFGCGVCAVICPHKAISIQVNKKGFYSPVINNKTCTNCNLCVSICPIHNRYLSHPEICGYAAWSSDDNIRYEASSGGAAFEIIRHALLNGYKVIGARYNSSERIVEHYISNTIEEAQDTMGSKYLQSYTVEALSKIDKNCKYLIIGTPCQLAAIRLFIKKKGIEGNFILVDFFCHGVPSKLLWDKYLSENKVLRDSGLKVRWRDKTFGWHNSWNITAKKGTEYLYYSKTNRKDLFYRFFLEHLCLCDSCYNDCIYKWHNSLADIRVGDFWDTLFLNDDKGVNCLLALSPKGKEIINTINELSVTAMDADIVLRGQMKSNAAPSNVEPIVLKLLKTPLPLSATYYIMKFLAKIFKLIRKLR